MRVIRTPASRRERGELGQGRVRAAQRCLDALYRDGAEPRHQQRRNVNDLGASLRDQALLACRSGVSGRLPEPLRVSALR